MKYFIQRQLNEYGPYTLADLQRYVAQGSILLTDLARSEGMTEWVPVSQVIGNIPVQTPSAMPVAGAPVYAGGTVYGGPAAFQQATNTYPIPPDLHWALVLLIGLFCSIFQIVWLFIEASFVKKIRPDSNFLTFIISGMAIQFGSVVFYFVGIVALVGTAGNNAHPSEAPLVVFVVCFAAIVTGVVVHIVGIFKMRRAIQEYYNTVEPINLRLSGIMTFFFNVLYFQYHFTRIANWKKTGHLQPQ